MCFCDENFKKLFSLVPKQKYAPSVFEKYIKTISLGGKEIKLNLYDTAGKKGGDSAQHVSTTRERAMLIGEQTHAFKHFI